MRLNKQFSVMHKGKIIMEFVIIGTILTIDFVVQCFVDAELFLKVMIYTK